MPKTKKIAPSPSGGINPYQSFQAPPPAAGGSGESSASRGRQRSRVYTPRACQNCQLKKTKCSGQPPPCSRCAGEKIECIFDRATDQRRREASMRKEEENQKIKKCLDQLLELLGGTNEQKLGRVREMVREGAQWESIQEFLDQMESQLLEESTIESSVAESSAQAQERNLTTPTAFDDWIDQIFGATEMDEAPIAFDEPLDFDEPPMM